MNLGEEMNTHAIELPPLPLTSFYARRPYETEFTPNYSVGHMRQYARAAVKAVLQSEQVQAWKRDAERYRWLRRVDIEDMAVVLGLGAMDYGSSVVVYTYLEELAEEDLDEVIDAAMEKQT